jgi:hypothetical protein
VLPLALLRLASAPVRKLPADAEYLVKGPIAIAEPETHQTALLFWLVPILEGGALVAKAPVVDDLNFTDWKSINDQAGSLLDLPVQNGIGKGRSKPHATSINGIG